MEKSNPVELAAEIVAAFVSNNSVPTSELSTLIQAVHSCERLERSGPADMDPTIQIRRSRASPLTSPESIRRTHHAEMG